MRFRSLLEDEDAVSPVVGVILMVAITVILAAVLAAFVMGFSPGEDAPQANWQTDEEVSGGTVDAVEFTHNGGQDVSVGDLSVVVAGERESVSGSGSLQTSDTLRVEFGGSNATAAGTEIMLVWSDSRDHVIARHQLTTDAVGEDVDSAAVV